MEITFTAEDSTISGPLRLTSYYVVAPYNDPKTRFNLLLGATVQVMQKEPTGELVAWSLVVTIVMCVWPLMW